MSQAVPLRSIQILRAVAACLVVFGHALHETADISARTGRPPLNVNVIDWGIGVDIFFVISGFIMIYTTAELFGQPGAMRTFLMRRIIRIVPLYWLMTAGLILTFLLAPKLLNVPIEGWRSIVTSFFFIPDLRGNGEVRPIMALGWSLNYEMFFYAVYAVCLLAPLRRAALYLTGFFSAFPFSAPRSSRCPSRSRIGPIRSCWSFSSALCWRSPAAPRSRSVRPRRGR